MSGKVKQRKAMLLNNTLRIIVFAALALYFNKWWIVLVSALFLAYEEDEKEDSSHE